ncbi:hypothetical protein M427DRAFT_67645 [Gonapodya prolifera JEL478]|uniref:Snf7-domain-containing protein n=1 Tax=Gonapodya prolifera (strain JEL478) TaxID=1344416 RepID=A0A139APD3_GONPJ|nr:hypothetical protein M427DRAFT_67645 [Gonapodya prolifera JEL478]|eukprot:KXS18609.1 hypothetical protein M427DRAFT_67645 [Gonapodya prolifera JEL478]
MSGSQFNLSEVLFGAFVKKWRSDIKSQQRELERQARAIEREEGKSKREIQKAVKRGDKVSARMLAREIHHGRRTRDRLGTAGAQLNSIGYQLNEMLAQTKLAGALQKSSQLMHAVNKVINLPEISHQMRELQRELVRAGVTDELMSETLDTAIDGADGEELEEEADMEVDRVLWEVTNGLLGQALPTPSASVAAPQEVAQPARVKTNSSLLEAL